MTDLDTLDRDRSRGARAREVLENPLIVEAFQAIQDEYVKAWREAPVRDTEGRERLWVMVKLIDKVKGHLEQVIDAGKIADRDMTEIEKRGKLRKLFG